MYREGNRLFLSTVNDQEQVTDRKRQLRRIRMCKPVGRWVGRPVSQYVNTYIQTYINIYKHKCKWSYRLLLFNEWLKIRILTTLVGNLTKNMYHYFYIFSVFAAFLQVCSTISVFNQSIDVQLSSERYPRRLKNIFSTN